MQVRQVEALAAVVLGERRLARQHRLRVRQAPGGDVVGVLAHEALQVASVVGVELALDEGHGVEGVGHDDAQG